jgi:hypothetical protein
MTAFSKNGFTLEKAASIANHANSRTTQLLRPALDELSPVVPGEHWEKWLGCATVVRPAALKSAGLQGSLDVTAVGEDLRRPRNTAPSCSFGGTRYKRFIV